MTTSEPTTRSPSRWRTTRSTPCVLGCCGPMLSTSSVVSNIIPASRCEWGTARSLDVLGAADAQPVHRVLHQHLAGPFERVVLPLRVALPLVGHEDAAQVRMAGKRDPEQVEDLAFEPGCRGPHAAYGGNGFALADSHFQAQPVTDRDRG